MPLPYRWLTSMMARYNGKSILIDCGEGTQIAMKEKGWSPKPIDIICFTHYHADHISGLPGMLLTMGNADDGSDDPKQLFVGRGKGSGNSPGIGHITADRGSAGGFCHSFCGSVLFFVEEKDPVTFFGKQPYGRGADSPGTTGDHNS